MRQDGWIVQMGRATRVEPLPAEHLPEGAEAGKYFVEVARFNLVGRALYNAAILEDDGSVVVAALQAGVINFCLPGRTQTGQGIELTYSTHRSNRLVYESLEDPIANWLLGLVQELNDLLPKEAAETEADVEAERAELEELREHEIPDDSGDPTPGSNGSPTWGSEAGPGGTRDASTPSKPPS